MIFSERIDSLLHLPPRKRGKIILVLGAGISKLSRIRHPQVILQDSPPNECFECPHSTEEYEKQRVVWSQYEYNRMFSRNVLPEFSYYFIIKLITLRLVRSIITTNYDSFLISSLKNGQPLTNYSINPILKQGNSDPSGYRSFNDPSKLRILFLHGSFDWAQFKECHCIVKLPRWAVGTNLWRVPEDWGGVFYHDYFQEHKPLPTGPAQHFIDWTFGRKPFEKEIKAAYDEINWSIKKDGILLLLGFRGSNCPRLSTWHEEISEPIAEASNKIPTFMVLTKQQADESMYDKPFGPTSEEQNWLFTQIQKNRFGSVDIVPDIDTWFLQALKDSPIDPYSVEKEYNINWRSQNIFLKPSQFEGK